MLYNSILKDHFKTPLILENFTSVWAQYTIELDNRELIQQKLKNKGIPTTVHYPRPLHLQECFGFLKYKESDFPNSEYVSKRVLSLPMNPYLSDEEILYICNNLITLTK